MRPEKVLRDSPWPHGHPCWVEVQVEHVERASAFYGQLFGWTYLDHGPDYQHYLTARLDGRAVADIGPRPAGDTTGEPSAWLVCFAVDSTDEAAEQITRAGGTVLLPPLDVGTHGRFAVAADPAGATFAVWQARAYAGTQIAGVAGSVVWHHCLSTDLEASLAFYADVFGHTVSRSSGPDGEKHLLLELGGRPVAGIGEAGPDGPAEGSSHWRVRFGVADLDAALKTVLELGGTLHEGPFGTPQGRCARVADEQGTPFEVLEVGEPA
ncbi:VOC family protein [Streptomyces qaidamensis]|jgi:predicted enzyme related to lactoylglutathione lyase|uniref:VOC family protein n=1 Tax=Streptomyces qaidamensis TaxID=1783515 RepID=UPI0036E77A7C